MTQNLIEHSPVGTVGTAPGVPRDRATGERHRRRHTARHPGLRDIAVSAGLMGLTGVMFWIIAGGFFALIGSTWLEP